jgi:hypothetical protein
VLEFTFVDISSGVLIDIIFLFLFQVLVKLELAGHLVITRI